MKTNSKQAMLRYRALVILILAIAFYCLDYYFRISPSLIIPELMQQYHTNAMGIGLFATAFYLGYLLLQLPIGYLLDHYSLHKILIISILCCVLTFILFLFCQHVWLGCVLRFAIGAASAFSFISVLYIARYYFPARFFNLITGLAIGIGTLFAALADIASSILQKHFSWQHIMAVITLFALLIIAGLMLPSLRTLTSEKKSTHTASSLTNIYSVLIKRRLILNAFIGGLMYMPTSIIAAVWGILFMQTHYHIDKVDASHGILYLFIGWALGSPIMGYLGDRLRYAVYFLIFGSLLAAGIICIYLYLPTAALWQIYTLLFALGLCSSSQVIIWKIFTDMCPQQLSGTGIAITNMIITLTSAVFHFIVGFLLADTQQYQHPTHIMFNQALWLLPCCFIIAALLSACMLKKPT